VLMTDATVTIGRCSELCVSSSVAGREQTDLRFARAILRHGMRHARGWLDPEFSGVTQTDLALDIDVSRPTVAHLVSGTKAFVAKNSQGIKLDPRRTGVALGIDFGEAHHRIGLADIHGQLFAPEDPSAYETPAFTGPAALSLDWALDGIDRLLQEGGRSYSDVWAVGVSLPGAVNRRTNRLQAPPPSLDRSWEVADLALPEPLPAPTVESDYNASALTEHLWGTTRGISNGLYVKISQRCACSLLIDHRIYRGADGIAGRLGKTIATSASPDGDGWALVEEVFSVHALWRLGYEGVSAADLVERAKAEPDGDIAVALQRGARALGIALAPVIDAINPEAVVIGGALGTASLNLIASDLLDGIAELGPSAARENISERLVAGAFPQGTALRGAIASALLASAPMRIAAAH
jgi:predicted NBD/HSP70 family sugar kinase